MRIMILEDDPLIGLDLQILVEDCGHSVVGPFMTVAEARGHAERDIDFALLDVDLPDGKSFGLAEALASRRVPFAFVSGSRPQEIPEHLRAAAFIAKPFRAAVVRNSILGGGTIPC